MTRLSAAAALFGGLAALPSPAVAQQGNIAEIVVYGTDPCPRSTDSEVFVCNRLPESERFRIPPKLRGSGPPQAGESWAVRSRVLETVGDVGTFSCSPVGPGGYTGCLTQVVRQAREQRRQQAEEATPPEE